MTKKLGYRGYTGRKDDTMDENKIRGVLIDTKAKHANVTTVERELHAYYKILDCELIDIAVRIVNGIKVEIICDDEGLFNDDPYISAIDRNGSAMFVGNIFIVGHDEESGDIRSLNVDECIHVMKRIHKMATRKHPELYPMLTCCEYC